MKQIIILLAFILNGCAVYVIKYECPKKEVVQEWQLESFKPTLPYYLPADINYNWKYIWDIDTVLYYLDREQWRLAK